jgi:hypothetical protein
MTAPYLPRTLETVVARANAEFPAVVLGGPRQSGKTTLLQHAFGRGRAYVSLERPDIRALAVADPQQFLATYPVPAIFDEIQYAPELLAYIKERIDAHRSQPGQYLLTGSQNLLMMQRVTESLAGRAAILRLLPLSQFEARGDPDGPLPWEQEQGDAGPALGYRELWQALLRGWYPELVVNPGRNLQLWHASYLQTYLERDVRSLRQIGDLVQFQSFLQGLAARSGQLLNLSNLARDLGVTDITAKAWLSVLEATFQVIVIRPYFANIGKRLVKRPKVYFTDTGTLCYLTGLRDPDHAAAGPLAGPIFETAVLSELVKVFAHRGEQPRIHFWRTASGVEVDFVVQTSGQLIPIEAKPSATPNPAMAKNIRALRKDFPALITRGYVIHPGDVRLPLGQGVMAVPFADI